MNRLGAIERTEPGEALAFLRDQFAQTCTGAGRLILVSGGTASGKTHLHNDFHRHANESGALALSASGAPDEQELDGGVLDQLVTGSALPAEVTDRLTGILTPAHAEGDGGDDGADGVSVPRDRSTMFDACRVLLRLARDRPMVISVDDIQFADTASLQLLLQLQRRIRSVRLLLVLTRWARPHAGQQDLHTSFTRQAHRQVCLTPMSERSVRSLVAESLGENAGIEFSARIHELSAGNPMLVNALIDDCRGGGKNGSPATDAAFSQAVRTFLAQWDAPLRLVAGAAAVLGAHASPELTARVAGVRPGKAEEMTSVLADTGLLAENGFRHPSGGAAALESLSPATRSQLHLRAAELKYQRAATVKEVATHLVAAGEVAGGWSIPLLRETADQAARAEEVGFATECLELALSATTEQSQRRAILRTLARITWRVNPSATSSYLAALRSAEFEHADAATLMRHSLWNGDAEMFAKALDVLTAAPETIDAQTEAEITLAHQWHFGAAGPHCQDAGTSVRHDRDPWNHTATALGRIWSHGGSAATTASAERILRNSRLSDTSLEALATAIIALAVGNKADHAEKWCAKLTHEAARCGAVTWKAMLDSVWAGITLRRGDLGSATERARSALGSLNAQSWGVSISLPLTTLLLAHTANGRFDAAAKTLRYPVPEAMFGTVGGVRYLRARGHFHLATDRVLAAVSDFQECRRLMAHWGFDQPALVPWRTDLAEATLRLGDVAAARDLANEQLELAGETDAYTRGSSLRVLAFAGVLTERPALLGQAAQCFKESGDRLELARTLKAVNQLRPRGEAAHGVRLPLRKRLPAHPVARGTATGLKHLDQIDSALLSDAELRVAQLAALGRTNREIGSALFITVSTVEQHLTRVYRKLGVRGRTDLPAELASATS